MPDYSSELRAVNIDLQGTRTAYLQRYTNLSWSKLQQFERCPANWFVENFAIVRDRQSQLQDHRYAFPGTIIQRIWEAIINDAVFRRPGFDDPKILARWCADQARALFQLLVMPVATQWERPQSAWRSYFATPEGEARRQAAVNGLGLDPVFAHHLQPQFVDETDIAALYGSAERCLDHIGRRFAPTIAALNAAGITLDHIEAERYVAVADGKFRLAGQIDFLVRPLDADRLADGYFLIDGKFRLGPTVEIGQLYFYALLIERADGITPDWLGFLDYGRGRLVGADGDGAYCPNQRRYLAARIARFETAALSLAAALAATPAGLPVIRLSEIPALAFHPNRLACRFCSIGHCCGKSAR